VTLPFDAPLDPSSDEARRWLEEELAKGQYTPQPGLIERFLEWLDRLLSMTPGGGAPAFLLPVVVVLLLAVLALVLFTVLRREVRPGGPGTAHALDIPDVDADTLRRRARLALEGGDWDGAVLDGVRAVARAAVERVVLDDAPGRTAHEVALALAGPFPGEADALLRAADAFDAVRYGDRRATPDRARDVLALDERLAGTRPTRQGATVAAAESS
jgi:Domain of unknown function (DUF4129)